MVFVHRITPTAVILLTMGLAVAMPATSTLAAENFGTRVPSVEEIKRGLTEAPDNGGPKMRGLVTGAGSKVTAKPSISMQVQFDFDSDKISPDRGRYAQQLGESAAVRGLEGEQLRRHRPYRLEGYAELQRQSFTASCRVCEGLPHQSRRGGAAFEADRQRHERTAQQK